VSDQEAEAFGIHTMAVDQYGNLIYNPHWVLAQTDTVMKAGVSHEVMHVCMKHLVRIGTRDPKIWNIAVDAAVNEILSHSFRIPDEWVRITQMAQKCSEEIYDWIIKNAKTYKMPSSGGFDSHIFGQDEGEANEDGKNKNCQEQGNKNSPFYQPGQQPFDVARAAHKAAFHDLPFFVYSLSITSICSSGMSIRNLDIL